MAANHPPDRRRGRPREVGLALSPAETDRLRGVLGAAGRTLAVAEDDRELPTSQRLAPQLAHADADLLRRMLAAERATVRLDVPVCPTPAETATLHELLDRAAERLDADATRRAQGAFCDRPGLLPRPGHRRARLASGSGPAPGRAGCRPAATCQGGRRWPLTAPSSPPAWPHRAGDAASRAASTCCALSTRPAGRPATGTPATTWGSPKVQAC
jgi:hypothetical protein